MIRTSVTATVTGAAGNTGYALLFHIASDALLSSDTPVRLDLLGIPRAAKTAESTVMELDDSTFPLLESVDVYDGISDAFDGTNVALLVGVRPHTKGMERADLLKANGGISGPQGKAISDRTADDVKVLIISNSANTNAVITMYSAPDVLKSRFTAVVQPDHNRIISQLAVKTGTPVAGIKKVTMWGNHSADQYPDVSCTTVAGKPASELVGVKWLESFFVPAVTRRGAVITEAHGASSTTSAASAAIDHVYSRVNDTPGGDWVTPDVYQDGLYYGVPEELIFDMPATAKNGKWVVIDGSEVSDRARVRIEHNIKAAQEGLGAIRTLGLIK